MYLVQLYHYWFKIQICAFNLYQIESLYPLPLSLEKILYVTDISHESTYILSQIDNIKLFLMLFSYFHNSIKGLMMSESHWFVIYYKYCHYKTVCSHWYLLSRGSAICNLKKWISQEALISFLRHHFGYKPHKTLIIVRSGRGSTSKCAFEIILIV